MDERTVTVEVTVGECDTRSELEARLRLANRAAKHAATLYLGVKKLGVLHQVIQSPHKADALGVSVEQMERIKTMPAKYADLIREVPLIAARLYEMHRGLVRLTVNRFARRVGRTSAPDVADFESEATVAFLEACRGYSDSEHEFCTYCGTAMKRRLRRSTIQKKGVNEDKLTLFYNTERALAVAGQPHTFRDVVTEMGLKGDKSIRALYLAVQPAMSESDMGNGDRRDRGGTVRNLEAAAVDNRPRLSLDADLCEAIDCVLMSDLEADSWRAWVNEIFPDAAASLKEVAEKHKVTPQAANFAKERARVKLAEKLRHWLE